VPTTHGVQAFVPDPLPQGLALPSETVILLADAERAVGRLAGTTAREFNPYLVASPLLHREAILSSRMEGTVTSPEQLVLLEAETETAGRRAQADDDTREVLNYVKAMQHGLGRLGDLPVSLRLITEIHRVLLSGVRGERHEPGAFRRSQSFIRGPRSERIEDARFVPPPVPNMKDGLDQLERYLHDATCPDPTLVRLALIHYQFETLHPFRDGNGRVGRLLIPLLMCSWGRLDAPILYVSAFFERHRESYMDLLLRVSTKGDWIAWIDFFLRGIKQSAEEATVQAIALLDLRQQYHRRFQASRASASLLRLIDRLFQSPSITIHQASDLLEMTHQGAANNVHRLEEAGILREMTGQKRNQVFVADEIIRFMYDPPVPSD
jgi:Fic family protein